MAFIGSLSYTILVVIDAINTLYMLCQLLSDPLYLKNKSRFVFDGIHTSIL
jgi:hypothetical protein